MVVTPCPTCRGDGRAEEQRTYHVDVPAGVDSGSTLRLSGRGAVGPRGGPAGDLYVHLRVRPHGTFQRDGYDLVAEVSDRLGPGRAGCAPRADHARRRRAELVVPAGTQSGRELRFRGKGVPHVNGRGRGDLRVVLAIDTPTKLVRRESGRCCATTPRRGARPSTRPTKGLFGKIKSAFS